MNQGLQDLLFSPAALLWLAGSAVAMVILLGTVNRRRMGLTKALRGFVDRNQAESKAAMESRSQRATQSSSDS